MCNVIVHCTKFEPIINFPERGSCKSGLSTWTWTSNKCLPIVAYNNYGGNENLLTRLRVEQGWTRVFALSTSPILWTVRNWTVRNRTSIQLVYFSSVKIFLQSLSIQSVSFSKMFFFFYIVAAVGEASFRRKSWKFKHTSKNQREKVFFMAGSDRNPEDRG